MESVKKVLKVKALEDAFFHNQRVRPGQVLMLKSEQEFSHRWMKPLGWTPEPPSKEVEEILNSPEHKARFKKRVPFDAVTHGPKNAPRKAKEVVEAEPVEEEPADVLDEEAEESVEAEAAEEQAEVVEKEKKAKRGKKQHGGDVI